MVSETFKVENANTIGKWKLSKQTTVREIHSEINNVSQDQSDVRLRHKHMTQGSAHKQHWKKVASAAWILEKAFYLVLMD